MNIREVISSPCKRSMTWVVLLHNKGEETSPISDLDKFIKLVGNLETSLSECKPLHFWHQLTLNSSFGKEKERESTAFSTRKKAMVLGISWQKS